MDALQEALARIGRVVEDRLPLLDAPGVAVGLTDRERLLGVVARGAADAASGAPVLPGTRFEIGSISKSFAAIVALQEREAGRLDLHAPVAEYVPWFEVSTRYEPITLHHLLSHTSGMITGMEFTGGDTAYEVWALRETETGFPPGERFLYSNDGYKLVGLVLETVVGQPIADILRERVLEPLGMRSTEAMITDDTRRNLAVGHRRLYDDRPSHRSHPLVPAESTISTSADGSIVSTAADMCAYMRMLLNGGAGPGGRVISEESFALLTQRVIENEPGGFYGYGLRSREVDGHLHLAHSGGMVGYTAVMTVDTDAGIGAIMLVNGYGERKDVVDLALSNLRALTEGRELPAVPPAPDPAATPNASDYAGTYTGGDRRLTLVAEGERLILRHGDVDVVLEPRGEDAFVVPHPELDRYLLRFGRDGGVVVECFHGSGWLVSDRYEGPTSFDHPPEWEALAGHYRSTNPWNPDLRVVLRKDRLFLTGHYEWSGDQELTALPDGSFRVGEEWWPSRIRFDAVVEGKATRAVLDCAPFYRTFTP